MNNFHREHHASGENTIRLGVATLGSYYNTECEFWHQAHILPNVCVYM